MVSKIRQILLTQYIGAILSAIVAAHCVQTSVTLLLSILWHVAIVWRTPTGVLGDSQTQAFDWTNAIYRLVDVLLNAAAVYGVMRWLYFGHDPSAIPVGKEPTTPLLEIPERSS